jgi:hypothetical protein
MTADQHRLLAIAELSARFLGFRFEAPCFALLTQALTTFDATTALPVDDPAATYVTTAAARLQLAEARVVRFVSMMVEEAVRGGFTSLHESTFEAAKLWFCPLFPIC